jgi:hypothetical protein
MSLGLLLMLLCGCIKTEDELTINADGSGKVRIETRSSISPEMSESMQGRMGGMEGGVLYPPGSEAEAQKFFPAKDFTVTVKQDRADNGDVTTVIEAEFKNINALLASAYGRAHQLSVKIADGALVVKGVTGMEATARLAEMKDETGMGMAAVPGLADLQKRKGEMRAEFRLRLPNEITTANGAHDGKTAMWIVERAKCKDAEEFARQLGVVSEARCSVAGLKMEPVTRARMGLLPFAELAAGAASDGGAVDTNKIASVAKYVPYGLTVTRSMDLSGGGAEGNVAQLIGAVELPQEFAPPKWGEPKLDEVVDARGNDLKPAAAGEERGFSQRSRFTDSENGAAEESATNKIHRHVATISFLPPDWKISEIARIKGSFNLQYFGGLQVVKLTNAVPAKWLTDASKMMGGAAFDSSEKPLNSAALAGLGLSLSVQMGMVQSGMTMLTLQVTGKQAALTDAQAFDADGKPWPTMLQQEDSGGNETFTCQVMIAGKPQPPLSLALLVSGGGATVEVPILLEHVSLAK